MKTSTAVRRRLALGLGTLNLIAILGMAILGAEERSSPMHQASFKDGDTSTQVPLGARP